MGGGQVPQHRGTPTGSSDSKPGRTAAADTHLQTSEPLDCTLGVEIEFMVATTKELRPGKGEGKHSNPGRDLVHEILDKELEAECCECSKPFKFKLPLNDALAQTHPDYVDNQRRVNGDLQKLYTRWTVASDASIAMDDYGPIERQLKVAATGKAGGDWYSVELVSRVMSFDQSYETSKVSSDLSHSHRITYTEEIRAVIRALKKAETPDMRLATNETCGLHIHIGNGARGFPLATVKNTLSLYTSYERTIDQMHTATRISGTGILHQAPGGYYDEELADPVPGAFTFAPPSHDHPLSDYFITNAYKARRTQLNQTPSTQQTSLHAPSNVGPDLTSFQPKDFIDVIAETSTIKDLQALFSGNAHHQSVDLRNLAEFEPSPSNSKQLKQLKKMTIEFRQHTGTLDTELISPWLDFVLSLVKFAHAADNSVVRNLCAAACSEPNICMRTFLDTIGVHSTTVNHYKDRLNPRLNVAHQRYEKEVARSAAFGQDHHLHRFMTTIARIRQSNSTSNAITSKSREKMKVSGYGQFSRAYLDGLSWQSTSDAFSASELDRITIGYEERPEPAEPEDAVDSGFGGDDEEGDMTL